MAQHIALGQLLSLGLTFTGAQLIDPVACQANGTFERAPVPPLWPGVRLRCCAFVQRALQRCNIEGLMEPPPATCAAFACPAELLADRLVETRWRPA